LLAALSTGVLVGVLLERATSDGARTDPAVRHDDAVDDVDAGTTATSSAGLTPSSVAVVESVDAASTGTPTSVPTATEAPGHHGPSPTAVAPDTESPDDAPTNPMDSPDPTYSEGEVLTAADSRYGACLDAAATADPYGSPPRPRLLDAAFEPERRRWHVVSIEQALSTTGRWFEVYFLEDSVTWVPIRVPDGCPQ
jgi:hypothetical protein